MSYQHARLQATPLQRAMLAAGLCLASLQPLAAHAADASLPQITVSDSSEKPSQAAKISSGALGSRAEIDTPFSVKAVTVEEIEDRQANSLGEILKYDASVLNGSSSNNEHPATVSIRGLRIDNLNGYKVDGLANVNRGTELPLEMFERVEVLKGLGGFMYGFGAPGGIVNYVSKRPTEDTTLSADFGYEGTSVYKEHVDAGGRFGDDQRFGYRLNLVNQKGDTAADSGKMDRSALGLALDARLTHDLTLSFDTLYQQRNTTGGTGLTIDTAGKGKFDLPAAPDGRTRLYSNGVFSDVDYNLSTLGLAYQMAPDWKSSLSFRHSDSEQTGKKDQLWIRNTRGDYEDRVTAIYRKYTFNQWQGMVEGKVQAAGMTHQLVFGAMLKKLGSAQPVTSPKTPVGSSNLYAPVYFSTDSVNYSGGIYHDEDITEKALFASDTVELTKQWSVLGGLRYTDFTDTGYSTKGTVNNLFQAKPTSPTVAVMYKPVENTTLYASYAESLEPTPAAPVGTTNANTTYPPTKSKQTEVGVKTEHDAWSGSAALFDIKRGATYQINNADRTTTYFADGEIRNRGLELNGSLRPMRGLSLDGSIMALRSIMERGIPTVTGKNAVGAPRLQAGAQASYEIPGVPGLSVRGGWQYVGATEIDSTNINTLQAYSLLDAGVNYRTRISGHMVTWRANVSNLTNRKYWLMYQENALNVGAPRTLSLNVRVDL